MPGRPQLTPELIEALAQSVSRRAAMIWWYLHSRARSDTGEAWPALRTIGTALGIRREHVLREIQQLETSGWLTVKRSPGSGNRYGVVVPHEVVPNTATDTLEGGPLHGNSY